MSLEVKPAEKITERGEITKILCVHCGEKIRGVGLLRGSRVEGLVFRCRGCGGYNRVSAQSGEQ